MDRLIRDLYLVALADKLPYVHIAFVESLPVNWEYISYGSFCSLYQSWLVKRIEGQKSGW